MARVVLVRGFGHFMVALKDGDPNPVQLIPAPAEVVRAEEDAGDVQVLVPVPSASPDPAPEDRCPVRLVEHGFADVAGLWATPPQGVALRAVAALVAAYPRGLTRLALNAAADAQDARNALRELVGRDVLWRAALRFPREKGDYKSQALGYRIAPFAEVLGAIAGLALEGLLPQADVERAYAVHRIGQAEANLEDAERRIGCLEAAG